MGNLMKFAVVIVTYNRKELLKECIHSVLTQLVPIQQVIIVDNASTDGTETILAEYKPSVTQSCFPDPIGTDGRIFHEKAAFTYSGTTRKCETRNRTTA